MTVALVIAGCVVLLVLAFLLPRLSRHPQRGANRALHTGGRLVGAVPGRLGHWLGKPFRTSSRMLNRSAGAGRRGRRQSPF
jgi:hypothetical protein